MQKMHDPGESVNKAREGNRVFREPAEMTLVDHRGVPLSVISRYDIPISGRRPRNGTSHPENMTELSQASKKAHANEERYRAIVENQSEFVCRYLLAASSPIVNDTLCRYTWTVKLGTCSGKSFYPFIITKTASVHRPESNPWTPECLDR